MRKGNEGVKISDSSKGFWDAFESNKGKRRVCNWTYKSAEKEEGSQSWEPAGQRWCSRHQTQKDRSGPGVKRGTRPLRTQCSRRPAEKKANSSPDKKGCELRTQGNPSIWRHRCFRKAGAASYQNALGTRGRTPPPLTLDVTADNLDKHHFRHQATASHKNTSQTIKRSLCRFLYLIHTFKILHIHQTVGALVISEFCIFKSSWTNNSLIHSNSFNWFFAF